MANNEFEAELNEIFKTGTSQNDFSPDHRVAPAVRVLVRAIVKLDNTSTFLAWVNIGVGSLVVVIGILQVWLMLRGH